MSIFDLETFTFSVPHYRFNPNPSIIDVLLSLQLPTSRQIWSSSSDVRVCRNHIIQAFFHPDFSDSNVLIMCDQDSMINIEMIEQMVIACSEHSPIIGSNMVYRGSAHGADVNWFLENDSHGFKRKELFAETKMRDAVISASHIGFGLVALHRSALEKMVNHFGYSEMGGGKVPNLFSEYRKRSPNLDNSVLEHSLKQQLKPSELSGEAWDKEWEAKFKQIALFSYHNQFPSIVYPETYSFCLRAKDLNIPIRVYLGVRPGHLEEVAQFSQFPIIIGQNRQPAHLVQLQKQDELNALAEIEL